MQMRLTAEINLIVISTARYKVKPSRGESKLLPAQILTLPLQQLAELHHQPPRELAYGVLASTEHRALNRVAAPQVLLY
jgi:hypothetical protein